MTASSEDDVRNFRASADGSVAIHEDADQPDGPATTAASVTRVPLHGPVDAHDVMCAKVIFALCGSVFPHPLLLAQQLLGIEDQDFSEFQLNVAEAGNNCIDIVAAYLTNLRVMQLEDEPNPPVSLSMIQPRHAATVASVATKARDLLCELALARATVKPRKAPKNKAIESAARAAAAAASATATAPPSGPASASSAGASSFGALTISSAEGDGGHTSAEDAALSDMPSDAGVALAEDTCGSESNDDASSCGGLGHQDTSREDNTPRTAREEEERLLYALQGPAAAEETLKMARSRPAGCKGGQASGDIRSGGATEPASFRGASHHAAAPSASTSVSGGAPASSPRAGPPPPPPPPGRTSSSATTHYGSSAHGYGSGGGRHSQDSGRGGGGGGPRGGGGGGQPTASLTTALSCPVTGLSEVAIQPMGSTGHAGSHTHSQHQQQHGPGHRRSGVTVHGQGAAAGGGRRNAGAVGGTRASPTPPSAAMQQHQHQQHQHQQQQHLQQQQHQQQQQQLAVAQLLGLRYGNNQYGNLMALQGAYVNAAAGGGLSPFAPAASAGGRLDLSNINSMAATTAALELAAQQAAAINAATANGMAAHLGYGAAAGVPGLGPLAGQFGSGPGGLGGLGGPSASAALVAHSQQQQAAAAAAVLLHQGAGGMMLADSLKGAAAVHVGGAGAAADAWSNVLLQAQLAGSLA